MNDPGTVARPAGVPADRPALEVTLQQPRPDLVARFRFDALTDSWWWSDGLLTVFGLDPEASPPSLEELMGQVHPEDRARAWETLERALVDGAPFSSRHRVVTPQGVQRHIVAMGEGVRANGSVIAVRGYLIDLTDSLRSVVEKETAEGIARTVATRAAIEQAKGALMATYGISAEEAFEALRAYSNHTNVKLNALAGYIVAQLVNPDLAHLRPQDKLGEILAAVTDRPGVLHRAVNDRAT